MKRQFILLDPDPPTAPTGGAPDGDPKPAPKKKDDATPPTAAEQAAEGKTPKEVALEKKVATLEDEQNTLKGQLKTATDWIAEQVKAKPAAKGSDVLDEVNEFLGWGT